MKRLLKLIEITPEGEIVAALIERPKGYGELKNTTGLSDRWLSKKLKELTSLGLVEHYENRYRLKNPAGIIGADLVFAQFLQTRISLDTKAQLIAEEISRNEQVVAVILFGSLARGEATEESDIDMLVVTEREMEDELNDAVYCLMFKYDVPVEAVFLTYEDLLINLQAKTMFSFGLLEGYKVVYDHGGVENLLSIKKEEIKKEWVYDEEVGAWFQKRLIPTLKSLKTS